jgi:hypothetical protein
MSDKVVVKILIRCKCMVFQLFEYPRLMWRYVGASHFV